ncbi:hypothetical protein CR513_17548, partial [Mucuna pruriens]
MYQCLKCGESQYKKKCGDFSSDVSIMGSLVKVLWYLPIIPRFKQLLFLNFGNEPRNLRIGFATNGMNSYENDINVYLSSLVKDLKMLWDKGVDLFDGYIN